VLARDFFDAHFFLAVDDREDDRALRAGLVLHALEAPKLR
jgi:hypothetical protein